MIRLYAKVVGVTVILIGVVGLLLGDKSLLGVLNIDIAEDGIHLFTGGLLAYAGFAARRLTVVRAIVGGIGIAYLVVGIVAFPRPMFFGLIPSGYETVLDNLIHLTLGVLGIFVGSCLRSVARWLGETGPPLGRPAIGTFGFRDGTSSARWPSASLMLRSLDPAAGARAASLGVVRFA